jgi:glycine dehydrogenase subunit 1
VPSYVPHTDEEIEAMLAFVGLSSLEELFASVPEALRLAAGALQLPPGRSEFDTLAEMERLAARNRPLVCFAGGGAYDHEIPAAVTRLAFRSEFVTAYTPYQPEVAQGVLQALFEYQTMVTRLTGVEVANASLYDGATACVEAVNVAVAATGRSDVVVSPFVNPQWRHVMETFAAGTGHRFHASHEAPAAIVVQQPNYLGCIEDLAAYRAEADRLGAYLIVAFDPVAAGLLRTPGSYGADVVVGEGQPFGTPLSFGGPYLGLFACGRQHVRRLPGRLVGETVDADGRRAYVTTLRTREQDIRREKASSNVCTNQTLIAVAFVIQMAWLGTSGLRELALRCARGTRYARDALLAIDGVEAAVSAPVLREFPVRTAIPGELIVERMAEEGFLAGVPLAEEYGGGLLVSVTEKRTREEIDAFAAAFEKVVR